MPHLREVKTCDRCRQFKRRCDLIKPSCSRCLQAKAHCSFDVAAAAAADAAASSFASASASASAVPASSSSVASSTPSTTPATTPATTAITVPITTAYTTPLPPIVATLVPSAALPLAPPSASSSSPPQDDTHSTLSSGGLISPTTSTESPEPSTHKSSSIEPSVPPESSRGSSTPVAGPRVVRKRKRNCLSCLRCHRLKVKCDKELPCSRCKSSGNGRECYYTFNKGPNGGKFPCPIAPVSNSSDENKKTMATWHVQHKVRGSSHWRDLMTKIGKLTSLKASPLAAALEDVATNACLANFTLPGNFPFGTPGATKYFARDVVARLVDSERHNCQTYIDRYIDLLDCVNPILDLDEFKREVHEYWKDPMAPTLDWLSKFLMVLGLGCFATVEEPHQATELMMAAEACLMQTPFMFRPSLVSLKTLCLMVVAKQVCNATCWSVDSCWSLLGLLVRAAFIYGLPQEKGDENDESIDAAERDARRKLWITILYLDIKVSMCTGMPPLTRPDELGTIKSMPEWGNPNTLHMVLYQSLPTVLEVLGHLNTKDREVSYPEVLRYNIKIRELMAHAQRVCAGQLQKITVDIFLRRCLMVLHRPFALHAEGPNLFPESYWSSLECSLALLIHYRDLWSEDAAMRLDLVGRAFVLDFFSAALTACLHVLRKDAPLSGSAGIGCAIPPRQIILDTLKSCVEIWSGERGKSVCYRTGYTILLAVLEVLPETSDSE